MVAAVKARLTNDGTLLTVGEFDETTQSTHSITADTIFSDEFDEVTMGLGGASGGSLEFNGTTQKLDLGSSEDFQFGKNTVGSNANDYTIEGWFFIRAEPIPYMRLWCFTNGDNVEVLGSSVYYWNGGSPVTSGAGVITPNAWYHIALVRNGGTVKLYVNGALSITDSSGGVDSASSRILTIGGEATNSVGGQDPTPAVFDGYFKGRISQFRIVKGVAVYTAPFSSNNLTPFTAVSGTKLLLNVATQQTLITDSSGTNKSITNTGGVMFSSSSPLSTANNGAMKQLKNGTLRVLTEIDEETGIASIPV